MSLTEAERAAGRWFRDGRTALLGAADDAAPCVPFIREYRHDCSARGGISWPLRLKERTEASPEVWVCHHGSVARTSDPIPGYPHGGSDGGTTVPAGKFTFTWVAGKCQCGLEVRSRIGRLAVT